MEAFCSLFKQYINKLYIDRVKITRVQPASKVDGNTILLYIYLKCDTCDTYNKIFIVLLLMYNVEHT